MFKSIDMVNLRNICSIFNLDFKDVKYIFEKLLQSKYDNVIIDLNRPSQKLRKNMTEVIAL